METINTLKFKYTTSRGQDTYGYNICSLYVDGQKKYSTCGGGYDMKGTVLGQYIKQNFYNDIIKLSGNTGSIDDGTGYYGLSYYEMVDDKYIPLKSYKDAHTKVRIDGACGFDTMRDILKAIGYGLQFIDSEKHGDISIYTVYKLNN